MNLYPAIDLYEGKVVRLEKGDFAKQTVYSDDPASFAKKWEAEGAQWIHVVDLEGAKTGISKNFSVLRKIRATVKCKIEFGGGLRTIELADEVLRLGIDRVVVGTRALDESFLKKALERFKGRLAIGLDAKDGFLQTEGWLEKGVGLEDALKKLNEYPVSTVIYTNIQRDGMLAGPDFSGLEKVLKISKANVVLSGGISSLDDLKRCHKIPQKNFDGVIIGKALYENKVILRDALNL